MLTKANLKDIYTATPMQEGMYYHFLNNPLSSSYLEQFSYYIRGEVVVDVVENALNELFKRYDILRTVFNHEKVGEVLQVALKERKVSFSFRDLCGLDDKSLLVERIKGEDKKTPFDLNKDVLMRATLIKLDEKVFEFIWTHHHILLDGWSVGILSQEFNLIYNQMAAGKPLNLPVVKQFKDYISWLGNSHKEDVRKYWQEYLQGYECTALIPGSEKINALDYLNSQYNFYFDAEISSQVSNLAVKEKVTLNSVLQTVWGILLSKYNNCTDVVFGTVVSGRPVDLEGSTSMVGLFINTIPCRINYSSSDKFIDLLSNVHRDAANSELFHHASLAEIQSDTDLKGQLFDHLFIFENYPSMQVESDVNDDTQDKRSEFEIKRTEIFEQTNYNFVLNVTADGLIQFQINYNAGTYKKSSIIQIAEQIKLITNQVIQQPDISIFDIQIVNSSERDLLLKAFNDTKVSFENNITLQGLFEKQVSKSPDAIALVYNDSKKTYHQLNCAANQIANFLRREHSVGKGDLIGVMMHRSADLIISILAILKTGAAYLPIDPDFPTQRIKYTLQDAMPKLLLTNSSVNNELHKDQKIISLELHTQEFANEEVFNLKESCNPSDLAYLIYTSGSTGRPKGVMLEHQGIVNRIEWMWKEFGFNTTDVIFQKTPVVFDVSVWEIFMTLCYGAKLVVCPEHMVYDSLAVFECIQKYGITTIHYVPTLYNTFLNSIKELCSEMLSLKRVIVSGDVLLPETVARHHSQLDIPLYNLYGPTEASVDVSFFETKLTDQVIPIGKPIANMQLYILDHNRNLMPVGVYGEICISGVGVARGYLNATEHNGSRFIENPYVNGQKMYCTGDIGRWLPSGDVEFKGRMDNQVKIRGIRIELGEIENALLKIDNIEDAIVVARQQQSKQDIIAYIKTESDINDDKLRSSLAETLPIYMIPTFFIQLSSFPLTSSGKVDRMKLITEIVEIKSVDRYAPPSDDTEKKILEIWKIIFEKDDLNLVDSFIESGGHSLKAIELTAAIYRTFQVRVPIKAILMSNISTLAKFIVNEIEVKEI